MFLFKYMYTVRYIAVKYKNDDDDRGMRECKIK